MWASILPVLGAALQIFLLWFKEHLEEKSERKKKIKELRDEFSKTLKDRDYSKLTLLWNRARRML